MVDAAALKSSWNDVARHGDQVPLFFYSTLFLTRPELRELFPVSMAAQRDRLVTALGKVVSTVDDLDALVPLLQQLGRDHRKFGVVREHYPAVGSALLATLEHFSADRWSDELARHWEAAYTLVARVMVESAEAAASDSPPWWEADVIGCDRRTLDIAVLTVRPGQPLPYRPGQSVALQTPLRPRLWRYYSPATLPAADGSFELHIRLVAGGPMSTALVLNSRRGDVLRLGAPVGHRLTLGPGGTGNLVLLAGGTGLAPMKAIVQQVGAEGGNRRVHLFWGVRTPRELYDLTAMRRLAADNPWLRLVPCVSGDGAAGDVEAGSVIEVALRGGSWPDHDIYVCGSPAMVRATVGGLRNAGTPHDRVHIEEFGSEETSA